MRNDDIGMIIRVNGSYVCVDRFGLAVPKIYIKQALENAPDISRKDYRRQVSNEVYKENSGIGYVKTKKKKAIRRPPRNFYIYVLLLEGENYYVGITGNVQKRFHTHKKGKGSQWTKIHKPIEVIESYNIGVMTEAEAVVIETEKTIETMDKYGVQRVRGGKICMISQDSVVNHYNKFKTKVTSRESGLSYTDKLALQEMEWINA